MTTIRLTEFGKVVRKLRIDADATLGQMAKSLEVTSGYLSSVEVGRKPITNEIENKVITFFSRVVEGFDAKEIQSAVDKTRSSINVEELNPNERSAVAAFARKVTGNEELLESFHEFLKEHKN